MVCTVSLNTDRYLLAAKRPAVDLHVPQQRRARSQTIVTGPPSMGGDRRKSRRIKTRGPVQNAPSKEAHRLAMIGFDPETGVFNVSINNCSRVHSILFLSLSSTA